MDWNDHVNIKIPFNYRYQLNIVTTTLQRMKVKQQQFSEILPVEKNPGSNNYRVYVKTAGIPKTKPQDQYDKAVSIVKSKLPGAAVLSKRPASNTTMQILNNKAGATYKVLVSDSDFDKIKNDLAGGQINFTDTAPKKGEINRVTVWYKLNGITTIDNPKAYLRQVIPSVQFEDEIADGDGILDDLENFFADDGETSQAGIGLNLETIKKYGPWAAGILGTFLFVGALAGRLRNQDVRQDYVEY